MTVRLVLDTSVFIAREAELAISVVTLAELRTGALTASEATRSTRLATYDAATAFGALPIDRAVADRFADLAHAAIVAGRKPRVQDLWIAATAAVHEAAVATRDGDFDGVPGIEVVKV